MNYHETGKCLPLPVQVADRRQMFLEVRTVSFSKNFTEHLTAAGTV